MIYLRIACILSVARTHRFSITAKQLSISHQAVSRNIQKTEEELGRQPLILPDLDEATSNYLIQSVSHFFPEGDYRPSRVIRVPNTSTAYAEVMCGNGYTISPDNAPRLSRRFRVLTIPDAAAPISAVWYYTQKSPRLPRYIHELMREEGVPC